MKRKKMIVIGAVVLAVVGFIFVSAKSKKGPEYETIPVTRQDLVQEVAVTGKVKPAEAVDLAFEQTGKVKTVKVKVGDRVKSGALLATLSSSDIAASLRRAGASIASARADQAQYQAVLESEKVKLEQILSGARDEDIRVSQETVHKAETALSDARENVETTEEKTVVDLKNVYDDVPEAIEESYTTANTAFREEIAPLWVEEVDFDRLSFGTKDSQRKTDLERKKMTMESLLKEFHAQVSLVPLDEPGRDSALVAAKAYLVELRNFLSDLSFALEDNIGLTDTNENLYRGYINTARASVNAAITSLVDQEQDIKAERANNKDEIQAAQASVNTAQKALDVAKRELTLKQAGPRVEEVNAQNARIKQAEANVAAARARIAQASADYQAVQANMDKTIIRSPQNGIVTKVDVKVGEFASGNKPVISVISDSKYEVEAHIPEVDIAKISIQKTAAVRLDAYGDEVVFGAKVSAVDPAETVVDGISTYTITLVFDTEDERIKSGMTANVKILTDQKSQVLAVPLRALSSKDNKKFVRVLHSDMSTEERVVETGLRGENGNVEILTGLLENEMVIVGEKTKK